MRHGVVLDEQKEIKMSGKQDWLDAGLEILADQGVPALTIDRLATKLGLTKGSFYHHFGGWRPSERHCWIISRPSSRRVTSTPPMPKDSPSSDWNAWRCW
ncbi:TetR/AcrR family transcriptional regulator [Saccharopolyspora sp. NPDC050642]|uniref:TetR/AcrR family transcriptional regulator n=1 Tax=Saccharopolyspora sp. NPDC050642 TaxID=3157099 RepID=UPI0033D60318